MTAHTAAPLVHRKFPWRAYAVAFVVIALFAFGPNIMAGIAVWIGAANGCEQTQMGAFRTCVIDGVDHARTLSTLYFLGPLCFITWVLAGIAFAIWKTTLDSHRKRWKRAIEGAPGT